MTQLPREDNAPFSLPRDTPEVMPIDYPDLNGNVDAQEAYDEGLDDIVDTEAEYRYGHPAHIVGATDGLDRGGLYITFEDDEPDIDVEPISWRAFFKIFEHNKLAFLYRTKTRSGAQSKFYKFMDRVDVGRTTEARRVA